MQHIDDIAATINLKKILGIGIYERNEDTKSHSEDLYYRISWSPSPSPSSSSLDSSTHRSSSSELSSTASTSSRSCFSAPPNRFKNRTYGCNTYRSGAAMNSNDVVATMHLKPLPSSSSLDSSAHRSSSNELSSRASTSSGSCFSAPPNRFKNRTYGCNTYRSGVAMDSNDVVATMHLKKILGIEADEQNIGEDSRSMPLSAVIVKKCPGYFSHLRYRRTRKRSSSSTSSGASTRTQYMSGLSLLPTSSTESKYNSDDEHSRLQQHQNDFHFREIQERCKRLGHYNSPPPYELPKPPAHWLTARAVKNRNSRLQNERNAACSDADTRSGKKNIIELLKSSSAIANGEGRNNNIEMLARSNSSAQATGEVRLSDMAYLSDLDMATENLKMLLKVKPTIA